MKIVKINKEGQITIPYIFRTKLNLKPNMNLCVYIEEGKLIMEPMSEDPIEALVELIKGENFINKDNSK